MVEISAGDKIMRKIILFFLTFPLICISQENKSIIDRISKGCDNCPEYENIVMPFEYLKPDHFMVLNIRKEEAFKRDVEMIVIVFDESKFKVKYYATTSNINCVSVEEILKSPENFREEIDEFDSAICPSFGNMAKSLANKMLKEKFISFLGDRNTYELFLETLTEALYIKKDGWTGWKIDKEVNKIFKEAIKCIVKKNNMIEKERQKQ